MHGDELGHVRSGGDPMSPTKSGTRVVWPSTDVERSNISRSAFYRDMLRIAKKLPVVEKIHNGGFDEITLQDCEKLFEVLDVDKSGRLDELEVSMLMKEVLNQGCTDEEVSTIFEQTDRVVDGKVSFAELHKALTDAAGAIRLSIERNQQKATVRQSHMEEQKLTGAMTRDLLKEKLEWRVSRDDAFKALPFTLAYLVVFVGLVIVHLQINRRNNVERAIESWVENYGEQLVGPFIDEHVLDIAQLWDWLLRSGAGAFFATCANNSRGLPYLYISSTNVLIGDVRLRQEREDGSELSSWLLMTEPASQYLRAHPYSIDRYMQAAKASVLGMKEDAIIDDSTTEVHLEFITYSPRARMFSMSEVHVPIDASGHVYPRVVSFALTIDPYPSGTGPVILILDGIYMLFLLKALQGEVREIIAAIRLVGLGGAMIAVEFWNFVDWLSILLGMTSGIIWASCIHEMRSEALQSLIKDRYMLIPDVMTMSEDRIDGILGSLRTTRDRYMALHYVMALNVVSIMLKFLKGFQCNARLQVVTMTLVNAASEIVHFSIVFFAIFVAFTLFAHIMFGQDVLQFRTIGASLSTGFSILMGEFEWYTHICDNAWQTLPSGMPVGILIMWFVGFMVIVLLVLINMLLAIILAHYSDVNEEVRRQHDLAPTLYKQTVRFVRRWRETRGYIKMYDLLCLLQNQKANVHPEDHVCKETLVNAFSGMKEEQALWLLTWLEKEARIKLAEEDDGDYAALHRLEHNMETMIEELHLLALNVSTIGSKVLELETRLNSNKPEKTKGDVVGESGLYALQKQLLEGCGATRDLTLIVRQLNEGVQELRRQQNAASITPSLASNVGGFSPPIHNHHLSAKDGKVPVPVRGRVIDGCCSGAEGPDRPAAQMKVRS